MEPQIIRVTVDVDGGVCWEACVGSVCLQDRSRLQLEERLAAAAQPPQPPEPEPEAPSSEI